jgi:16S rRNA (uracil1498-N3)-methyltransferase
VGHVFRFFVAAPGAAGAELALAPADRRHAESVLRLAPGDLVEVADAAGAVWTAELCGEGRVRLAERREAVVPATGCTVWLALAGGRSDLAVEKLTELGVRAIGPLLAERAKGTARLERWRRVAEAASKQAKRGRPPELLAPAAPAEALAMPGAVLLDHEAPDAVSLEPARDAVLLVGPEAGWSDAERAAARAAGAPIWRLPGDLVLRSETAAIVAAALAAASGR